MVKRAKPEENSVFQLDHREGIVNIKTSELTLLF